jgi:hypothetical protein
MSTDSEFVFNGRDEVARSVQPRVRTQQLVYRCGVLFRDWQHR